MEGPDTEGCGGMSGAATEDAQLFLISPPRKQTSDNQQYLGATVEERISLCLQKFAPRAKLSFGSVTAGQTKTFPVEIVIPAAKGLAKACVVTINRQAQKGKHFPQVVDTSGFEVQDVALLPGSDRVEIKVVYAPATVDEDGVLGSIALQCKVDGLLLKADLVISGKAVKPVAPVTSKARPTGSSSLAKSIAGSLHQSSISHAVAKPMGRMGMASTTASRQVSISTSSLADRSKRASPSGPAPAPPSGLTGALSRTSSTSGNSVVNDVVVKDQKAPPPRAQLPSQAAASTPPPPSNRAAQSTLQDRSNRPARLQAQPRLHLDLNKGASKARSAVSGDSESNAPPSPTASHISAISVAPSMARFAAGNSLKAKTPGRITSQAKASRTFIQVHTELPLAKQERALGSWLNSHLAAYTQEYQKLQTEDGQTQVLALQRMAAQVRGLLWRQYKQNTAIFDIISKVYSKVDGGYFIMTEKPLMADVREVQLLLEPFMSYHPFWLRLGLVTVLRDASSGTSGASSALLTEERAWRRNVPTILRECFLYEREIQDATDKAACWAANKEFILKNFLLLVLLLDKAVTDPSVKLPKGAPPLFDIKATHKSSKEIVRAFLSGRMCGIGDVLHHLELWGYKLEYVQQPVDEYDYSITNMKEDLRSGIRLAKLYELLTGCDTLLCGASGKLHLCLNPTLDQQRVDNVSRVIDKYILIGALPPHGKTILTRNGRVALRAKDIVDANRDVTLGMLWSIAMSWQLAKLINMRDLRMEIRRLLRQVQHKTKKPVPEPLNVYPDNMRLSMLMKWAQAVCMLHGVKVYDFRSSFGDGRVLCYMIATYLPGYLSVDQIYQPSAPKPEDVAVLIEGDEDVDLETLRAKGWCAVYEAGGCMDDQGMLKSYKEGVRHNFALVHTVARHLGRIPEMLSPDDILDGGLEEKAVILYVAHLCSRLLELSTEDRAAAIITQALRRHLWVKKYGPELERQQNASATVFQKYWRGYQARRLAAGMRLAREEELARQQEFKRQQAATLIQACWRGHQARDQYGHLARFLARVLVKRQGLVELRRTARMESATVVIQAAWRMHSAQSSYQALHRGITRLQALWRMHLARSRYLAIRSAVVLIQRTVRSCLILGTRRQREAAMVIQAHWRGAVCRTRCRQQRSAAVTLQAAWRGRQVRQQLRQQHQAATTVQTCYRGFAARRDLALSHHAATTMQALWRGRQTRLQVAAQRQAATQIQAGWRGFCLRRELQQQHVAAVAIQSHYRGHLVRKQTEEKHQAAILVQSVWRGHLVRAEVHAQRHAAVLLQAHWRGHVVRQQLLQEHRAATIIQAHYRGHLARQDMATMHRAASVVQSVWRGRAVRQQLHQQHRAATLAQACWRGHSVRQQVLRYHQAATCIQAAFKGHLCKRTYQQQQQAAATIQRYWRGRAVRQRMQQHSAAITRIQAAWRMHRARAAFLACRGATIKIQTAYRCHAAHSRFQAQRRAAVIIQRVWRGHIIRASYLHVAGATVQIQAAWRAYAQRKRYLQERRAVVLVQAAVRRFLVRKSFQQTRQAVTTLQAGWRGHRTRQELARQHQAAALIQRCWRGHKCQQHYSHAKEAVTRIQSHVRGWLAQQHYQRLRAAAVLVQAHWRGRAARTLLRQHRAARSMQSMYRGYAVRRDVARMHAAATVVQAHWRGATQRQDYLRQRQAVVTIQSHWRMSQVRRDYQHVRGAAVTVQRHFKGYRQRKELQRQARAATVIQAAWRAHAQRMWYQSALSKVVLIQAFMRGWAVRRYVEALRGGVSLFEYTWLMRKEVLKFRKARAAALLIQRYVRGWLAKRAAVLRQQRIVLVQSMVRGRLCRKHVSEMKAISMFESTVKAYLDKKKKAALIQAHIRGYLARKQYGPVLQEAKERRQQDKAVQIIQKVWCAGRERQAFATITRYVPVFRARLEELRAQRKEQVKDEAAVIIQSYVRMWLARRRTSAMVAGITRVQALWRGYSVRKTAGRSKAEARRKLMAAATQKQPQKSIGVRTREALEVLLGAKQNEQVTLAVSCMSTNTYYSRQCCELIAKHGGIGALLRCMSTCNRSKPHVDILKHILNILTNICRYNDLVDIVFNTPDCVTILTERLQFFRDQEDVFMAAMVVVDRLLSRPGHPLKVGKMPNILRQWEGIAQILYRRMDVERKYISRLEGQKGSDASAREATRKLLAAQSQHEALQAAIDKVSKEAAEAGVEVVHHNVVPHGGMTISQQPTNDTYTVSADLVPVQTAASVTWQPKNTLVRSVVKQFAPQAAAAAAVAKGEVPVMPVAKGDLAAGRNDVAAVVVAAIAAGAATAGPAAAAAAAAGPCTGDVPVAASSSKSSGSPSGSSKKSEAVGSKRHRSSSGTAEAQPGAVASRADPQTAVTSARGTATGLKRTVSNAGAATSSKAGVVPSLADQLNQLVQSSGKSDTGSPAVRLVKPRTSSIPAPSQGYSGSALRPASAASNPDAVKAPAKPILVRTPTLGRSSRPPTAGAAPAGERPAAGGSGGGKAQAG